MNTKNSTKDILTLTAAAGALGLGLYYFFYVSNKKSSNRASVPFPPELTIPTKDKAEFEKEILKHPVKEVNGLLDVSFLVELNHKVLTFLMPFFEPASQTARDSRRTCTNDMTKYVEVAEMYSKLFEETFFMTVRYAMEVLGHDYEQYFATLRSDYNNEYLLSSLSYFPYYYESYLPPKKKVDATTFLSMSDDLFEIIDQQAKLIEENIKLFDKSSIHPFMFIRVYDTIYERYGYEFEDFSSIFGGFLVYFKGADPKCLELRDKYSQAIADKLTNLETLAKVPPFVNEMNN